MKVTVYPTPLQGTIDLPSSKSALHRAIICASLAGGTSTINNVTFNDDAFYTLKAFEKWGIKYKYHNHTLTIIGRARPKNDKVIVDCGESASTLRFLIPLFSQFSEATFIGKKSLLSRPLDVYQEIYANQLLDFNLYPNYLTIKGQIKPEKYIINDPKSSQFISGLLFYLPLLEDDSIIEINNLVSKPYLDLTLEFLKQAKINIIKEDNKLIIPGNQRYQPFNVDIEGDLSQIGYFLTLGAFGGPITINNINFQSLQGDKQIIDLFTKINAQIEFKECSLTIYKSNLSNFMYDLSNTLI